MARGPCPRPPGRRSCVHGKMEPFAFPGRRALLGGVLLPHERSVEAPDIVREEADLHGLEHTNLRSHDVVRLLVHLRDEISEPVHGETREADVRPDLSEAGDINVPIRLCDGPQLSGDTRRRLDARKEGVEVEKGKRVLGRLKEYLDEGGFLTVDRHGEVASPPIGACREGTVAWMNMRPRGGPHRSEERRVGKEGRSRWSPDH